MFELVSEAASDSASECDTDFHLNKAMPLFNSARDFASLQQFVLRPETDIEYMAKAVGVAKNKNPFLMPAGHPLEWTQLSPKALNRFIWEPKDISSLTMGFYLSKVWAQCMIRRGLSSSIPFEGGQLIGGDIPTTHTKLVSVRFSPKEKEQYDEWYRWLVKRLSRRLQDKRYVWDAGRLRELLLITSWLWMRYAHPILMAGNARRLVQQARDLSLVPRLVRKAMRAENSIEKAYQEHIAKAKSSKQPPEQPPGKGQTKGKKDKPNTQGAGVTEQPGKSSAQTSGEPGAHTGSSSSEAAVGESGEASTAPFSRPCEKSPYQDRENPIPIWPIPTGDMSIDEQIRWLLIGSPKLRAMLPVIMRQVLRRGEKSIVWVNNPAQQFLVAAALRLCAIDIGVYHAELTQDERQRLVSDFTTRSNECMVLICSYYVSAAGLNLQDMCRNIHIFDSPMSEALLQQAIGRCARLGQQHPVLIYDYQVENSFNGVLIGKAIGKALPDVAASLNESIFSNASDLEKPDLGVWAYNRDGTISRVREGCEDQIPPSKRISGDNLLGTLLKCIKANVSIRDNGDWDEVPSGQDVDMEGEGEADKGVEEQLEKETEQGTDNKVDEPNNVDKEADKGAQKETDGDA